MCTAFTLKGDAMYFGRNMDIEYGFGEAVVITPREYSMETKLRGVIRGRYAMIGMGNVTGGYPLYAEAANERGLCMAGLNFPGSAVYLKEAREGCVPVTPYELIPLVLGSCAGVGEARALLETVDIVDIPFSPAMPTAPLHWIVADSDESIVLERTEEGMRIYDNPFGVLTNNPPFPFHRENVRQYINLRAGRPENAMCPDMELSPFGQGAGAMGLPGDYSPASRFAKTVFCKMNSVCGRDRDSMVSQVFHILDAVAMVSGSVITGEGKPDVTTYSCCIDTASGDYYYKTYGNNRLTRVELTGERKTCGSLTVFELGREQDVLTV